MYYGEKFKHKAESMRKLIIFSCITALSACGSMPIQSSMQSSFNGERYQPGPTNIHDSRFGNPAFYSESDGMRLPSFE
jgi:hypothetical protein